ncbi:MAG: hypothetical protein HQL27_06195, partial [Candidatus Omnitrophica bacterium]|nr:hypothetical protein [Candidatus Omnitrophota bacterium]
RDLSAGDSVFKIEDGAVIKLTVEPFRIPSSLIITKERGTIFDSKRIYFDEEDARADAAGKSASSGDPAMLSIETMDFSALEVNLRPTDSTLRYTQEETLAFAIGMGERYLKFKPDQQYGELFWIPVNEQEVLILPVEQDYFRRGEASTQLRKLFELSIPVDVSEVTNKDLKVTKPCRLRKEDDAWVIEARGYIEVNEDSKAGRKWIEQKAREAQEREARRKASYLATDANGNEKNISVGDVVYDFDRMGKVERYVVEEVISPTQFKLAGQLTPTFVVGYYFNEAEARVDADAQAARRAASSGGQAPAQPAAKSTIEDPAPAQPVELKPANEPAILKGGNENIPEIIYHWTFIDAVAKRREVHPNDEVYVLSPINLPVSVTISHYNNKTKRVHLESGNISVPMGSCYLDKEDAYAHRRKGSTEPYYSDIIVSLTDKNGITRDVSVGDSVYMIKNDGSIETIIVLPFNLRSEQIRYGEDFRYPMSELYFNEEDARADAAGKSASSGDPAMLSIEAMDFSALEVRLSPTDSTLRYSQQEVLGFATQMEEKYLSFIPDQQYGEFFWIPVNEKEVLILPVEQDYFRRRESATQLRKLFELSIPVDVSEVTNNDLKVTKPCRLRKEGDAWVIEERGYIEVNKDCKASRELFEGQERQRREREERKKAKYPFTDAAGETREISAGDVVYTVNAIGIVISREVSEIISPTHVMLTGIRNPVFGLDLLYYFKEEDAQAEANRQSASSGSRVFAPPAAVKSAEGPEIADSAKNNFHTIIYKGIFTDGAGKSIRFRTDTEVFVPGPGDRIFSLRISHINNVDNRVHLENGTISVPMDLCYQDRKDAQAALYKGSDPATLKKITVSLSDAKAITRDVSFGDTVYMARQDGSIDTIIVGPFLLPSTMIRSGEWFTYPMGSLYFNEEDAQAEANRQSASSGDPAMMSTPSGPGESYNEAVARELEKIKPLQFRPQEAKELGWETAQETPRILTREAVRERGGIKATDLCLVRRTSALPEGGIITSGAEGGINGARRTIHFAVNHAVKAIFGGGNWDAEKYLIIVPLSKIPKDLIEGFNFVDTWVRGSLELPEGSLVLGPDSLPEGINLGKATFLQILEDIPSDTDPYEPGIYGPAIERNQRTIEQVIEKLGFTPVEGGDWGWYGDDDFWSGEQFNFARSENIAQRGGSHGWGNWASGFDNLLDKENLFVNFYDPEKKFFINEEMIEDYFSGENSEDKVLPLYARIAILQKLAREATDALGQERWERLYNKHIPQFLRELVGSAEDALNVNWQNIPYWRAQARRLAREYGPDFAGGIMGRNYSAGRVPHDSVVPIASNATEAGWAEEATEGKPGEKIAIEAKAGGEEEISEGVKNQSSRGGFSKESLTRTTWISVNGDLFIIPNIVMQSKAIFDQLRREAKNNLVEVKSLMENESKMKALMRNKFPLAAATKVRGYGWSAEEEATLIADIVLQVAQNVSGRTLNASDQDVYSLVQKNRKQFEEDIAEMFKTGSYITIHPFLVRMADGSDMGIDAIRRILEETIAHERFHQLWQEEITFGYYEAMEKIIAKFENDPDFKDFYDRLIRSYGHIQDAHGRLLLTEEFWSQIYFNSNPEKSVQEKMALLREKISASFSSDREGQKVTDIFVELNQRAKAAVDKGRLDVEAMERIGAVGNQGLRFVKADDGAQKKGGIDFNPRNLKMDVRGRAGDMQIPARFNSLENIQIDGFVPVIINVTPITNLPLLLGISLENEPEKLSYIR